MKITETILKQKNRKKKCQKMFDYSQQTIQAIDSENKC